MNYEWTIRLIQCSETLEERRRRRSNPADEVGIGPIPGQLPIRGCWTGINWESAVTVVLTGFNFSTFSLDVMTLWSRGAVWEAFSYVTASVVLSIIAIFLGYLVTKQTSLNSLKLNVKKWKFGKPGNFRFS